MKLKSRLAMIMAFSIILTGCGSAEPAESQESSTADSSSEKESSSSEEAVATLATADAQPNQELIVNVLANKLSSDEIAQEKKYIGTIEAEEMLYVSANSTDKVAKVYKSVGDTVSVGDILFQLDQETQQDALAKVQLKIEKTKAETDKMLGSVIDDIVYNADSTMEKHEDTTRLQERKITDLENEINISENKLNIAYKKFKLLSAIPLPDADDLAALAAAEMELEQAEGMLDLAYSALEMAEEKEENHQLDIEQSNELAQDIYGKSVNESVEEIKEQARQLNEMVQLEYDEALKALNDTVYTSPIAGVVYSVSVTENNLLNPQLPAFIIANSDNVVVDFAISQAEITTMAIGDNVIVEIEDNRYEGAISQIPQSVDVNSGSFMAKAVINNAEKEFSSGERVSVYLMSDKAENTIVVPLDSVYFDKDNNYVYTVEDERAVKTPVEIGIFNADDIEITKGLTRNDVLITSWSGNLKNGVKVNIVE